MFLAPWNHNRAIENTLDQFFDLSTHRGGTMQPTWSPSVDITDGEKEIRVKADIPGLKKQDIDISVEGNTLTIKGERTQENKTENDGLVRTERVYGSFYRAFTLPRGVDTSKVKASYKDGVLDLTLPKTSEAQPKQIEIEVE